MNDQSEAVVLDQVRNYRVRGSKSKNAQLPLVSEVQCLADKNSFQGLDYAAVADSTDDFGIDPEQQAMMEELVETAKVNNGNDKLMMFPHMAMYL